MTGWEHRRWPGDSLRVIVSIALARPAETSADVMNLARRTETGYEISQMMERSDA